MFATGVIDEARLEALRQLPPMMPQFLRKRRAGLSAVREIAAELGIIPPLLFTLVQMRFVAGSYGDKPITEAHVRALDPYATRDLLSEPLAQLAQTGLLLKDGQGSILLSPRAAKAVEQLQVAGRAHVAALQPLPPGDLANLARLLQLGRDALQAEGAPWNRPGAHILGAHSFAVSQLDASVMVNIEQAIYDLWMARDDAHIAAWRAAGLEGPAMAALTQVWSREAGTLAEIAEKLRPQQSAQDVESSVAYLVANGYIEQTGGDVSLTPQGARVRDSIEGQTDRIYFEPWPHTLEQAERLRTNLRQFVDNLPSLPT